MNYSLVEIMEILGTLAFASSGTTRAIRKQYDLFGLFVLSFTTAIGGGTLRDLLIGNTPVNWLNDFTLISVIIAGTVLTYLFYGFMNRLKWWVFFFDAIGLGLFTITGVKIGIDMEYSVFITLLLGVLTASFGGVLRDILSDEKPLLLQNEIYATASIGGGIIYLVGTQFTWIEHIVVELIAVTFIILLRVLSYKYKWSVRLPIKQLEED